jgi:hypothetical protein
VTWLLDCRQAEGNDKSALAAWYPAERDAWFALVLEGPLMKDSRLEVWWDALAVSTVLGLRSFVELCTVECLTNEDTTVTRLMYEVERVAAEWNALLFEGMERVWEKLSVDRGQDFRDLGRAALASWRTPEVLPWAALSEAQHAAYLEEMRRHWEGASASPLEPLRGGRPVSAQTRDMLIDCVLHALQTTLPRKEAH